MTNEVTMASGEAGSDINLDTSWTKKDEQIYEHLTNLAAQFIKDAKAIDPSIDNAWIGYGDPCDRAQRLCSIYLTRRDMPFVRQKGGEA